jgi:hypothetical protein
MVERGCGLRKLWPVAFRKLSRVTEGSASTEQVEVRKKDRCVALLVL